MAGKAGISARKIVIALVIGVVASVIGSLIYYTGVTPRAYAVQIIPVGEGDLLKIAADTLRETPNQDGILFVYATITTEEENAQVVVEVRPKEETVWYKQHVQQAGQKTHVARIQLGSKEWPISGGEAYLLRASSGNGKASARISVEQAPTETR